MREVCGVMGCQRKAVTEAAGWPKHKDSVHLYFHEPPCSFCDSEDHCVVDCVAHLENEKKLNELFGVGGGYDWEDLRTPVDLPAPWNRREGC